MRTPDTPDSPASTIHSPTCGIRHRVGYLTAGVGLTMLASLHCEREKPVIIDTTISLPSETDTSDSPYSYENAVLNAPVTDEQQAQLDAEIDACFDQLSFEAMATIGLFTFNCPDPEPKDLKNLLDSLPRQMRPHIIRIAKLLALHPEECERVKQRVCSTIGISLENKSTRSSATETVDEETLRKEKARQARRVRREAHRFLHECDECDEQFEEALDTVLLAEFVLRSHRQQVADIGK